MEVRKVLKIKGIWTLAVNVYDQTVAEEESLAIVSVDANDIVNGEIVVPEGVTVIEINAFNKAITANLDSKTKLSLYQLEFLMSGLVKNTPKEAKVTSQDEHVNPFDLAIIKDVLIVGGEYYIIENLELLLHFHPNLAPYVVQGGAVVDVEGNNALIPKTAVVIDVACFSKIVNGRNQELIKQIIHLPSINLNKTDNDYLEMVLKSDETSDLPEQTKIGRR